MKDLIRDKQLLNETIPVLIEKDKPFCEQKTEVGCYVSILGWKYHQPP